MTCPTGTTGTSGARKPNSYAWVSGGRVLLLPIIEALQRLDATNLAVRHEVLAWSKGFVKVRVEVVANVRIARAQPLLDRAATRLAGKLREELAQLVRDELDEAVGAVIAEAPAETFGDDRALAETRIATIARDDLARIGLELDTIAVLGVTDDVGYLEAVRVAAGRR